MARYRTESAAGLADRSSRPTRNPPRTDPAIEARVLRARAQLRVGPDAVSDQTGVPARTVTRILRRHHMPPGGNPARLAVVCNSLRS